MVKSSRAKSMRQDPTPAEQAMWRILFWFREEGLHFRRQVPIGPYYADFACHHALLVIEVDGDPHAERRGYDARRDAYLAARGYRVMRFSNGDVMTNDEGVFRALSDALASVERKPRK